MDTMLKCVEGWVPGLVTACPRAMVSGADQWRARSEAEGRRGDASLTGEARGR